LNLSFISSIFTVVFFLEFNTTIEAKLTKTSLINNLGKMNKSNKNTQFHKLNRSLDLNPPASPDIQKGNQFGQVEKKERETEPGVGCDQSKPESSSDTRKSKWESPLYVPSSLSLKLNR